jgi:hypothetical protein
MAAPAMAESLFSPSSTSTICEEAAPRHTPKLMVEGLLVEVVGGGAG